MAIEKLKNGFRPKVRGTDGRWLPLGSFNTKNEALDAEAKAKRELRHGVNLNSTNSRQTVADFFQVWIHGGTSKAALGWKEHQLSNYNNYVHPVIGSKQLVNIKPSDIATVLVKAELKLSPQSRLHIYNFLHKMFGDAIEMYELLSKNPVMRSLKPVIPKKESPYLSVNEAMKLLQHVKGKACEVAICLNLYVGMRVGEIQSLRCADVNLDTGMILIKSTFIRKEFRIQDHPKGKEWHSVKMPPELQAVVAKAMIGKIPSDFLASDSGVRVLSYSAYLRWLKKYCAECKIQTVATHGLRHSTSEIYVAHGATVLDMNRLFAHSSMSVTERYMHDKGERVQKIADGIRLFPNADLPSVSSSHFKPLCPTECSTELETGLENEVIEC